MYCSVSDTYMCRAVYQTYKCGAVGEIPHVRVYCPTSTSCIHHLRSPCHQRTMTANVHTMTANVHTLPLCVHHYCLCVYHEQSLCVPEYHTVCPCTTSTSPDVSYTLSTCTPRTLYVCVCLSMDHTQYSITHTSGPLMRLTLHHTASKPNGMPEHNATTRPTP